MIAKLINDLKQLIKECYTQSNSPKLKKLTNKARVNALVTASMLLEALLIDFGVPKDDAMQVSVMTNHIIKQYVEEK